MLPPTLNITEPNTAYDAKTSPFAFYDAARPWPDDERRAGVSAFGFGGTNFHAVLSSYAGDDDAAARARALAGRAVPVPGRPTDGIARAHSPTCWRCVDGQRRGRAAVVACATWPRTCHHRAGRGPVRVAPSSPTTSTTCAATLAAVAGPGDDAGPTVFAADGTTGR